MSRVLPTIETIITYMELRAANIHMQPLPDGYAVTRIAEVDYEFYISLYRSIGRNYLWNYRPGQSPEEVITILNANDREVYVLSDYDRPIGMAEIVINDTQSIEIVHFGLIPEETGQRLGGFFLSYILSLCWRRGAMRVWLSTCGLDHPKAVQFYERHGFTVYDRKYGTFLDYRYSGFYDMDDAPNIPHGASFFNGQVQ